MPLVVLRVNGRTHRVDADPSDSLLGILRGELGLIGSKYGCGEGQCGACTVLVDGRAVRACVTRVDAIGARAITTIEGVAEGDRLHPVQQSFLEAEAFQCGYCTPGMVMSAIALLRSNPNPSDAEIVRAMDGNICRCGTYSRIVRAVHLAASSPSPRLRGEGWGEG